MPRRSHISHITEDEAALDMTPMLDVVFIMLIFFIVSASFVRESGLDVSRPQAETTRLDTKASMVIAIGANNQIWVNRRQIKRGALRAQLERLHAENPKGGAVITADKQADTGVLVQVMDALRLSGVQNISIAADKPQ
ncbi:MAG: biopolymer transporter ExbD [Alphaproteobacteria bacterium]|nr:biopolymer transporter ExbD [Alphaproteobacteria bacterium]